MIKRRWAITGKEGDRTSKGQSGEPMGEAAREVCAHKSNTCEGRVGQETDETV